MRSIKSWPAEIVEKRAVSSLVPYARNARTHSENQINSIAASITEFGRTVPALIDEAAFAKALREVDLFRPTGEQMHDLVAEIHAWLDRVKFNRGEIVDPAAAVDVILRDADEMIGG